MASVYLRTIFNQSLSSITLIFTISFWLVFFMLQWMALSVHWSGIWQHQEEVTESSCIWQSRAVQKWRWHIRANHGCSQWKDRKPAGPPCHSSTESIQLSHPLLFTE